MKAVFFLLLVANIGLFAWQYYREPSRPTVVAPGSGREGNLTLLSESHGLNGAGEGKQRVAACYALNSKGDEDALGKAADQLRAAGYAPSIRNRVQTKLLGYWVYIPPAATFDDAQAIGQQLANKGIDDYTFVVGADKTNAISLGLYADRQSADQRVAVVEKLGFRPRVEKRYAKKREKILIIGPVETPPTLLPSGLGWKRVDCQSPGG